MFPTPEKPVKHLSYLDSVRGIAALMVVAYRFINWKHSDKLWAKLGSIVFNGSDAVSFFFVLSGFVLSYQYIVYNRGLDIRKFYINRFFRLWPAFFVCVALNALNWVRDDLSLWKLKEIFLLNKTQFWEEALLFRSHVQYYVPGWTLVIEFTLSFTVPFMIVLGHKNHKLLVALLVAVLLIGNAMGVWYMFHFHFALGVLISCLYGYITSDAFRQSAWYRRRYWVLLAALILYSTRHIDRIFYFGDSYHYVTKYIGLDFFHYTAIASFVFIVAIIRSKHAHAILNHRLLLFLGKISYGIYLMHWVLVTDVFIYWDRLAPYFPNSKTAYVVIFIAYVLATIVLATLLHYTVEIPFMKVGKKLTRNMRDTLVVSR